MAQPGRRGQSRPIVVGDVVYFGTGDGMLVARDRATGAAHWAARVTDGAEVAGANLVARSGVVVAAGHRHVAAVDAATGAFRWRYEPPLDTVGAGSNPAPGSLLKTRLDADDELLYVPAWGASVSAVELATGRARWVWQPGKSAGDTAASGVFRSGAEGARVSGDTVFVTAWHFLDRLGLSSEPWLVAIDRSTGRELWRVVLPSYTGGVLVQGAPALYRNMVIFATVGGIVWAVDRTTTEIIWHHEPPPRYATTTQAEVYGDMVYAAGGDERVYALRAADGEVSWAADGGGATRDLLVTERYVYIPKDGELRIVERESGRLRTTALARDFNIFETPPTAASGRVFVAITPAAWSFDEP